MPTAEWLYEAGIGERRALLVADGRIIATEIDRDSDGPRAGAVVDAKFMAIDAATRRAELILLVPGAAKATLARGPAGVSLGAIIRVQITRAALREAAREKPARAVVVDGATPLQPGPDVRARIAARGWPARQVANHGDDELEAAGWGELCDAARTGEWPFACGALAIALTPAMTLIDIDGGGDPAALALAGASAAAAAIGALGIGGSIGIDFPTVANRAVRHDLAAVIDAALPQPFERTAVNGFGFMQIVRRRVGPSLAEREQYCPNESDALRLLRQASRARGAGTLTLTTRGAVAALLEEHPQWTTAVASGTGRPVMVMVDPAMKGCGHAQ